ncbi:MAG: hypothetical protein HOP12_08620 [Candidatus Eisenbacteria bacterium]|uniref:DUF4367 domain-containing protein n=1 Tax=Eiseniibacteriota bacterium TaxID=2212470 RepID=A0A849SI08_UNCEI|nr:hypothetical protein [Candidatus Eisenbacteria bacterium]
MSDDFLNELRESPRPAFERALRERLRGLEAANQPRALWWRPVPVFATVVVALVVAAPLAFPSVRATAQAFLDLFRVRTVTAIQFDPERLDRLHEQFKGQDPAMLVFHEQQVLKEPGVPVIYATPAAATAATGLRFQTPSTLPPSMELDKVQVAGEGRMRLTFDPQKLRTVLDLLDLRDVRIPDGLAGQTFDVRVPRVVTLTYASPKRQVSVMQCESPEIKLPPGFQLSQAGELGLRVLGLDASEAQRLANSIDWSSTLVVPLPITATSFREVTVHGQKGVLVESRGDQPQGREHQTLLWSEAGQLRALTGTVSSGELVQMAESMR